MSDRTIGVMARLLDQHDGLGVYSRHLLQQLLTLDPHTRYVIFLGSPQSRNVFQGFNNAQVQVIPAGSRLLWDQVLVRWKGRGPVNDEYVAALQRGWQAPAPAA